MILSVGYVIKTIYNRYHKQRLSILYNTIIIKIKGIRKCSEHNMVRYINNTMHISNCITEMISTVRSNILQHLKISNITRRSRHVRQSTLGRDPTTDLLPIKTGSLARYLDVSHTSSSSPLPSRPVPSPLILLIVRVSQPARLRRLQATPGETR